MLKRVLCTAGWLCAGIVLANAISLAADAGRIFDVKRFGARGDGKTYDTRAIQSAIDAANQAGGGAVVLPAGNFPSASLVLKSHVELRLEAGATLLGSEWLPDYPKDRGLQAFLVADGQEDIAISGAGTIDGQGRQLVQDIIRRILAGEIDDPLIPMHLNWPSHRVKIVVFRKCRNVRVSDVTMKDAASWVQNYVQCDGLVIKGIHVISTAYRNNDGLDITDCTQVRVSDCDVNASDDGICLKSERGGKGCEDVEISHCRIRSSASALKLGTASYGGFRNIYAHDLEVYDTFRSAVALESVDGGVLKNIRVENITATNTGNAIFLKLGHRVSDAPVGTLSDVTIRNVKVDVPAGAPDAAYEFSGPPPQEPHNVYPSSITGLPGHPVTNVLLENIEIIYAGGGVPERAHVAWNAPDQVPEQAGKYPEFSMFGELPAWGFYVRHAEGMEFRNCQITLQQSDYRPAMIFDDVRGVHLTKVDFGPISATPVIVLNNVSGEILEDVQYPKSISKEEQIRRLGNGSPSP